MMQPPSSTPRTNDSALSADRYRQLVESVIDYAIVLVDEHGTIRSWNEGVRRLQGYEAQEIVGQPMSVLYPEEANARGWPQHELAVARQSGRFEDEGWRLRKDGSRFWANVVITAMHDAEGRFIGYSKVTRDLTERRRQEELVRRSEERFRLLVDRVKDYAIFMLTPEGRVATWNEGAQSIKGYAASEIIGSHISRFYEPEAIARRWPDHELEVARRTGRFEDEGWRVRKDGSRFWANVVITALFDDSGELYGFAKVTRDLTARVQMEELRRSGRQMTEFLAMLAHELRNPLAPMRTSLDVLERAPDNEKVVAATRGMLGRQLTHLTRLVDDLLDVSRITTGRIVLEHETIDAGAVVSETVASMRSLIDARRQHVTVDVPTGEASVRADPTRLAQIVSNLISNAIKYTPENGRIDVTVTREDDVVALHVKDNGRGIPPELQPRIFDLFVQGERALAREEGGLGIGLTLVKRLVELHGGTVTASSQGQGRGSEFTVRLPRVRPVPAPTANGNQTRSAGQPLTALVVDDNPDVASSMAMLLSMLGHTVETAHDGPSALVRAPGLLPDVVLLDIGLPRMNGYEVARALRSLPALDHTMLVAVTGYGREDDRQKALDAGFDRHVVKPVAAEALMEILGAASRRRSDK